MVDQVVVLKILIMKDKAWNKVMKVACTVDGVIEVKRERKENKLIVIGQVDPVDLVIKLRKFFEVEILSVVPAKEEKKGEKPAKDLKILAKEAKKKEKPGEDLEILAKEETREKKPVKDLEILSAGPAKEDKREKKPAEDLEILAKEEKKEEKPAEDPERLSGVVVGTSSGSGTKMLGQVGNLSATSLEKVVIVDNVSQAHPKDVRRITNLSLEWEEGHTNDSQNALDLLSRLQTLTDLEQLSIINYGGINFSDWIRDHSFSRIVYMWLSRCKKCHHLPALGKLRCLKSLSIDEFDMVKRIGDEFYTNGSSTATKPFMSLEKLSFKFMPRWMEWSLAEGGVFPQLKELHLMDCPSLTLNWASFPDSLPSLTNLYVSKCQEQVVASLLSGQLPLLSSLHIAYLPELVTFPQRRLPTNIHTIEICGCENLKFFSEEGWPSNLKSLSIGSCGKLFAPDMLWNLQTLTSLASLDLSCIDDVADSFPEEEKLPTTMTSLILCHLHNLKFLNGKAFRQLTSLEELSISYCQQLQRLPKEGFPRTLTSLHLSCLDNLKSLNGNAIVQLTSLEKLSISYCPLLLSMPEEALPASLSQLTVEWCPFLIPRCHRETGEDWPKIAHIPCICIIPN